MQRLGQIVSEQGGVFPFPQDAVDVAILSFEGAFDSCDCEVGDLFVGSPRLRAVAVASSSSNPHGELVLLQRSQWGDRWDRVDGFTASLPTGLSADEIVALHRAALPRPTAADSWVLVAFRSSWRPMGGRLPRGRRTIRTGLLAVPQLRWAGIQSLGGGWSKYLASVPAPRKGANRGCRPSGGAEGAPPPPVELLYCTPYEEMKLYCSTYDENETACNQRPSDGGDPRCEVPYQGPCDTKESAEMAAKAGDRSDPAIAAAIYGGLTPLYSIRDQLMTKSAVGREYIAMYYVFGTKSRRDPRSLLLFARCMGLAIPAIETLMVGRMHHTVVTKELAAAMNEYLDRYNGWSDDPELKAMCERVRSDLNHVTGATKSEFLRWSGLG